MSPAERKYRQEIVLQLRFLVVAILACRSFWQIVAILDQKEFAREYMIIRRGRLYDAIRARLTSESLAHAVSILGAATAPNYSLTLVADDIGRILSNGCCRPADGRRPALRDHQHTHRRYNHGLNGTVDMGQHSPHVSAPY